MADPRMTPTLTPDRYRAAIRILGALLRAGYFSPTGRRNVDFAFVVTLT